MKYIESWLKMCNVYVRHRFGFVKSNDTYSRFKLQIVGLGEFLALNV